MYLKQSPVPPPEDPVQKRLDDISKGDSRRNTSVLSFPALLGANLPTHTCAHREGAPNSGAPPIPRAPEDSLKLNGKPIDVHSLKSDRGSLLRFLDSSAADELFSKVELEKRGYTRSQLEKWGSSWRTLLVQDRPGSLLGKSQSLRELDKQLKAAR
jgi:hypothetical protein